MNETPCRVGFAFCGSFCTFSTAMSALEAVKARFGDVTPIVSENSAALDTRFGEAHNWLREMERICDKRVIDTLPKAEPIAPKSCWTPRSSAPARATPWPSWPRGWPIPPSPWQPRPTSATVGP